LSLKICRKDVRVIVGVGIGFVVRKESHLVAFWAKTQRMIVERTRSELAGLGLVDIREPNVRAQTIREGSAGFVLDAINHSRIVGPAHAVEGITIRLFAG